MTPVRAIVVFFAFSCAACTWGTYDPTADGGVGFDSGTDGAPPGPIVLVDGGGAPSGLQISNGQLFWALHQVNYVMQCTLPQCGTSANVFVNAQSPDRVHITSSSIVAWSDHGGADDVETCHVGTTCSGGVVVSSAMMVGAITSDATNLYWTDYDAANGAVKSCALPCSAPGAAVLASPEGGPMGIGIASNTLYWANHDAQQISFCVLPTCTPQRVPLNVHPNRLAVDTDHLFFTSEQGVSQCVSSGCTSVASFASVDAKGTAIGEATYVAIDSTNVYFATVDGRVLECPRSGCPSPKTLGSGQGTIGGIALDANSVYWTSTDLGLVVRATK